MNTFRRSLLPALLPLLLVLGGGGWFLRQRAAAGAIRQSVAAREARLADLEERLRRAGEAVESRGRELALGRAGVAAEAARAARLAGERARPEPGETWTRPPAVLPAWEPASPYIWVAKPDLARFPIQAFGDDGGLSSVVAEVLTLEPERLERLNRTLAGILAEYRSLEAREAKVVDEHLPGIAEAEGVRVSVRVGVPVEEGKAHRDRFEAALRAELGEQRAGLVMEASQGWVAERFNPAGGEVRMISVLRRDDGTYQLASRSGSSWISVGGPRSIEEYLPLHLRPLFAPVLAPREEAGTDAR